eukprot:gene7924-5698_t
MSDLKRFLLGTFFIAGGVISLVISGLQYTSNVSSEVKYYETYGNPQSTHMYAGDDICTTSPFSALRPFKFSCSDGYECSSFCGYGQANTAYRMSVAALTFLGGIALLFKFVTETYPSFVYWSMFSLAIIWFTVTVADITALVNSTDACVSMWETWYDYASLKCDNATYGVTIALDLLACIMVLGCWVLYCWMPAQNQKSTSGGSGSATYTDSNPRASKSGSLASSEI